ncbi:hypothetical protein DM01DRAFT_1330828 [Hesseltinella vesiculosa]|uniref:Granulins domain-containing protein n=1 Tax=Hesseltinella vesiculosa TaxID=101127 RepID=A0A1X2GX83_9FUNG|nr:hypothetical protein DM01DRAFT_1330828 [Hesseltinella vesiculosa]
MHKAIQFLALFALFVSAMANTFPGTSALGVSLAHGNATSLESRQANCAGLTNCVSYCCDLADTCAGGNYCCPPTYFACHDALFSCCPAATTCNSQRLGGKGTTKSHLYSFVRHWHWHVPTNDLWSH